MRGSGEKVLNEIAFFLLGGAFARRHSDHAFAATALCAKRADGSALDKTAMRDANDAALVRDEVFHIDLCFVRSDFRQARRTVFVADFAQYLFDDGEDTLLFGENVAQVFDGLDEILVFLVDLFALETGQLIQAEVENFIRLLLAERVAAIRQARGISNKDAELFHLTFGEFKCEQFYSRFVAIGRSADNTQEFSEAGERNQIT